MTLRTTSWTKAMKYTLQCRANSSSAKATRRFDVMAKYRRPIFPSTFETASTIPAAASFQEIPPPSTKTEGIRKAIPIPAMAPVEPDIIVKPKEKGKEIIVEGIVIPPKPVPPKDDECCMSGCVNCVYNLYADDLELYTQSLKEAHEALAMTSIPKSEWPDAVKRLDGNKSEGKEGVKEEMGKVEEGIDPVTMAFLEMERKLKKKQIAKGA